jgi:hypothetical protein
LRQLPVAGWSLSLDYGSLREPPLGMTTGGMTTGEMTTGEMTTGEMTTGEMTTGGLLCRRA